MKKGYFNFIYVIILAIIIVSCAKKGSISGGIKDEIPPEFVKAFPPNFSTNFDKNEIRIYFDEYIKLKDAQKQIIISPPMDPQPTITPLGSPSKYIKIEITDTLLENTTYSINFGQSIVDNNEENPFSFFNYVFSTGNYLDSLSFKGVVVDALKKEPEPFITVALYELNEAYNDSLIYKEVPRYIASTLDSIVFNFNNLKAGNYKMIALKDAASNYTYQPSQDQIGFYEENITVPVDSTTQYKINIFQEILDFRAIKPKQVSKNEFVFGYEGNADSMKIKLLSDAPEDLITKVLRDQEKDTLHYWYKPFFEADSLIFEVSNAKNYRDTLVARYKDQYADSLTINPFTQGTLAPDKNYTIIANTPLESINEKLITLVDRDTLTIPFSTAIDTVKNTIEFLFEKTEDNSYSLKMLPEAVEDFLGNKNDTLNFTFRTQKISEYGTIFLTLNNVKKYPVIVQLTDDKYEVKSEMIALKEEILTFKNLKPGQYNLRVILDDNSNGKWDTGNFLKGIQPERVSYFPELIDVRANWELKQTFTLK